MAAQKRMATLDWLRAVAVGLVLFRHMPYWDGGFPDFMNVLLKPLHQAGWAGVDLFFVLSGFLVSGLLFREYQKRKQVRIGRFLTRRGLKIYPQFYALIIVSCVVELMLGNELTWKQMAAELLFIQNYAGGYLGHTWSLGVEEHFYIGVALAIGWLGLRSKRNGGQPFKGVISGCLLVMGTCLALRCFTAWSSTFTHHTHVTPTHLRIDSLAFGVLLSYLYAFKKTQMMRWVHRQRPMMLATAIAMVSPAFFLGYETLYMHTVGFTLLALGSGGFLLLMLDMSDNAPAQSKKTRFTPVMKGIAIIGANSYGIYLWHYPMLHWGLQFSRTVGKNVLPYHVELVIYFVMSIASGILITRLVEKPVLMWRDRYFPSNDKLPTQIDQAGAPLQTGNAETFKQAA
ncbi:MAG TPA: hypothetical protein DCM28_12135 [Phycisphaerales bacterium]|nr:hypothetical protein [Phycisphaerales bacterium]